MWWKNWVLDCTIWVAVGTKMSVHWSNLLKTRKFGLITVWHYPIQTACTLCHWTWVMCHCPQSWVWTSLSDEPGSPESQMVSADPSTGWHQNWNGKIEWRGSIQLIHRNYNSCFFSLRCIPPSPQPREPQISLHAVSLRQATIGVVSRQEAVLQVNHSLADLLVTSQEIIVIDGDLQVFVLGQETRHLEHPEQTERVSDKWWVAPLKIISYILSFIYHLPSKHWVGGVG